MYIPASFVEHDLDTLHDFVEANSFATLVSTSTNRRGAAWPEASHLPLLCERECGALGSLVGHMAAANPQWKSLDGEPVLVIFQGPHAYISPAWYEVPNIVPTWNYVAVHAYGRLQIERDPQQLVEIVRAYVAQYEATMPQPWSLDSADPDFITRLLDAIVGFRIEIERIEGKWKLSQNHSTLRRNSVIEGLRQLGGDARNEVADLMAATRIDPDA